MVTIDFGFVVSASLHQLESHLSLNDATLNNPLEVYLLCRRLYLMGDVEGLSALAEKYALQSDACDWLKALLDLRLHIRLKKPCPTESGAFAALSAIADNGWRAEAFTVMGIYLEEQGRFAEAKRAYAQSAQLFHQSGLKEKAITADYNALIAQTLAVPKQRYIVAYHSFVLRALEANHPGLAGVALANLAREYQLLNLNELALENAQEALKLLKVHQFGTLHYYLTVAQTLDLLLNLGRKSGAKALYEDLLSSPYRETAEIVKVIQHYCQCEKAEPVDLANLPKPWVERHLNQSSPEDLQIAGQIESRIVQILTSGPQPLSTLATELYGDRIDPESSLARAKQAVYRLRKKVPGLIAFRKGRYELVD